MASSLIHGQYVICAVTADGVADVIPEGAVYQENGRIVEIGPLADVAARHHPDEVLGSREHVVFPGLVNSHHHVGLTPFQLGSPDHPLELWFASRLAARDVDPYLDTLYSAFEMLESGVTTVQHLHGVRLGPATRVREVAHRIIQAYQDVGMRVSYSYATRDQNRLVYEADEDFGRRLPPQLAGEFGRWIEGQRIPLEDHLRLFVELWEYYGQNTQERVRIQLAPANLHWCSDDALGALRDHSDRYGVPLHMHLVETPYQKEYAWRRTGTTALRHLDRLGLLGPALTLGHGVWLTEDDVELVARTGTMVCHNASSNLRLRSGVAPVTEFLRHRVPVALGLDEAGINDDRDMLQEMRLVLRLHRIPGMEAVVPTPAQVFRMATQGGAATTPFADRIGTLAPGRGADLVLMPWRDLSSPYLEPGTSVVDALVHRGRAASVETVVIAGEVVLRGGRITGVDKSARLAELAAQLERPRRPEEERRRQLAEAIFPHVQRFYERWLDPASREPFYRANARR